MWNGFDRPGARERSDALLTALDRKLFEPLAVGEARRHVGHERDRPGPSGQEHAGPGQHPVQSAVAETLLEHRHPGLGRIGSDHERRPLVRFSFCRDVDSLREALALMREKLNLALAKRFGRSSEQVPAAQLGLFNEAEQLAEQALTLLSAPECTVDTRDLLLMPNQMVLQIHESIGHPLELDRILGDERNYAGTSFVTEDMFGSYRFGSDLLNVTFDPNRPEQLASYGFDDEGTPAQRSYLIRNGILQRPLGGASSQTRAGLAGVANARACSWNRPPIDRMANLNVEPGDSTVDEMIAGIERGVYMETNRSWSIDDSRNKFQFGCELGRLIENGELKGLVRNPNYRGISATFWRNLAAVGNEASFNVQRVTNCGKGEPNQSIYVGHASPPCHFRDVDVFGGGG